MVHSFLFGIYHSSELFVSTERIELLPIKLEQGQFDRKQLFVKMSELISISGLTDPVNQL